MAEPRTYQTEAVVLKKVKLGEADRILTLYTLERGKIEAVARGIRKSTSKMAGHLELLTHSLVTLARGRTLDTIIGSQTINGFYDMKNNLWLTSCGLYVSELINQFNAEHVENRPVFHLFIETLKQLCENNNTRMIIRHFEIQLLELSGYKPQLQVCSICQASLKPVVNAFCAGTGGLICPKCMYENPASIPVSVDAVKVLRFLQQNDVSLVKRLKVRAELSDEIHRILSSYIHYILEREVKSSAWLDTLSDQIGKAM